MASQGVVISSKQSIVLDLPPSCIELCLRHPKYFVVGTYNLQKEEPSDASVESPGDKETDRQDETIVPSKPQSRNGTLIVYQLDGEGSMKETQVFQQPSAILDLHFCPLPEHQDILAVVSSTGTLAILKLDPATDSAASPLQHLATSTLADVEEGVLFLSCAWHPTRADLIAITTSAGEVRLVRLDDSWRITEDEHQTLITHSLEAWTVAFSANPVDQDRDDASLVAYSGGDDSALRYVSLERTDVETAAAGLQPIFLPLKLPTHDAGVTAILPTSGQLGDGSSVVITGSYDDKIRVLAIQPPHAVGGLRKFAVLAEADLGGGVWRLKPIKTRAEGEEWQMVVLASCMHAGARIVRISGSLADSEGWNIQVLSRFEEHKSMNYGSDFVPPTSTGDGVVTCLSTSFYDKLLCLWDAEVA